MNGFERCTELYYVLCADGGGSGVRVTILGSCGEIARGHSGPSNVCSVGVRLALQRVLEATTSAIRKLVDIPVSHPFYAVREGSEVKPLPAGSFASIWLGLAGVLGTSESMRDCAANLLGAYSPSQVKITNDSALLGAPVESDAEYDSIRHVVAVIAGTGSCSSAWTRSDLHTEFVQRASCGGWGQFLGDEGGAYAIGRLAIRSLLSACYDTPSIGYDGENGTFHQAILLHFGAKDVDQLVSKVYDHHVDPSVMPDTKYWQADAAASSDSRRRTLIAALSPVVFCFAFGEPKNVVALDILHESILELASLVRRNYNRCSFDRSAENSTALVLGGSLLCVPDYARLLLGALDDNPFQSTLTIKDPSIAGARALLRRLQQT